MRTSLVVAAVLALVLAATAVGAADARRPALRITDVAPLTVRGTNFRPGERVKLLVNAGRPITRAVRAGVRGGFVARLGVRVDAGTCSAVVQAIGSSGSRALVDMARPGCDERP